MISVGGDVMAPGSACRWGRTPMAAVCLLNAYGPTEATITATLFRVPGASPELSCRDRVPIGRPLGNRSLYILDRCGVPVPIGVPGELCLGGALLARHLGGDSPFYGLQVPDRDGELLLTTIEEMAEHYVEAIREVQPEGPYRLGGWSMGGIVALEMARQLCENNHGVDRLVLIDSRAPSTAPDKASDTGDAALAFVFARDLAGIFGVSLPVASEQVEPFDTAEEVLGLLHEKMQAAGLVPPGLELPEIVRLFAMFRINVRAMERYSASAYSGRLVLFKAGERLSKESEAPDLGWSELAEGGLEIHEIGGNHYSILRDPHVEVLADCLAEILDPAWAPGDHK
ncbi:MAG: AMP-binding protein [bacterium]|nr:AMP-binding protein [bacterium]